MTVGAKPLARPAIGQGMAETPGSVCSGFGLSGSCAKLTIAMRGSSKLRVTIQYRYPSPSARSGSFPAGPRSSGLFRKVTQSARGFADCFRMGANCFDPDRRFDEYGRDETCSDRQTIKGFHQWFSLKSPPRSRSQLRFRVASAMILTGLLPVRLVALPLQRSLAAMRSPAQSSAVQPARFATTWASRSATDAVISGAQRPGQKYETPCKGQAFVRCFAMGALFFTATSKGRGCYV